MTNLCNTTVAGEISFRLPTGLLLVLLQVQVLPWPKITVLYYLPMMTNPWDTVIGHCDWSNYLFIYQCLIVNARKDIFESL